MAASLVCLFLAVGATLVACWALDQRDRAFRERDAAYRRRIAH